MANQPSFNPNNRSAFAGERFRNRAATDVFEPGSTVKPFTVAAAIEAGEYHAETMIDTSPGYLRVRGHTIRDVRDFGRIDVTTIIQKSSNVGASKIALSLDAELLWGFYQRIGFGAATGSGFPGESGGWITDVSRWRQVDHATLAFGYGLAVTPLQLAQAYAVLANDGVLVPAAFVLSENRAQSRRLLRSSTVRELRQMLESVITKDGTGYRAQVPGYRVAGKTGTVKKSAAGGYAEDRYLAVFAGFAPASDPRLVAVVVIDEPRQGAYYGGEVAAPVFSRVMAGALRLMDIPPDAMPLVRTASEQPSRGSA
jgi:cell division protein FtsI (penicillin-binding protein 3)